MHLGERGARRLAGGAVNEDAQVGPITEKTQLEYINHCGARNLQMLLCCISCISYQNHCSSTCIPWWHFTVILSLLLHFATPRQIKYHCNAHLKTKYRARLWQSSGQTMKLCHTIIFHWPKKQGEEVRKGIKDVQTEKYQEGFVQSNSTRLYSAFSGWSC